MILYYFASSAKEITYSYRLFYLCVMGWPWLAARCPASRSLTSPPQQGRGRKQHENDHGLR